MGKRLLERVTIANPCTTDWDLMTGDERKRYCQQCDKHVYNLSQMTHKQAEALLMQTGGKLCARFERRADGSILTADQSFSLPRFNSKFLRLASATVSAALSLSPSLAAKPSKNLPVLNSAQDKPGKSETRLQDKDKVVKIYGKVLDQSGAVIANASITATNEITKESWKTFSSTEGEYKILLPSSDDYSLTFEVQGFKKYVRSELSTKSTYFLEVIAIMEVGQSNMGVVVIAEDISDISTSPPTKNLKLKLKEETTLQNKKPKKGLADVLLAPIKKIKGGKNK